jgi:hypothetical protein
MSRFLFCLLLLAAPACIFAQTPRDKAIPVQITAGLNPPAVFLSWENETPSHVILRRRIKGDPGNAWTELVNVSETLLNGYFDTGLDGSKTYEYALEQSAGNVVAQGFGYANFFTPEVDNRGKILVFIDSTTADLLGADLITFKNDLRGEGWQPVPFKTGPFTTAQWVKNQIVTAYNADPDGVKAVLLMGPVPVPYSGSTAWDTRPDHEGAWPCDAWYGDVNGVWTDNTVNLPNTARIANRNVPGDGKFDQNTLPSAIELPVGRLDFRRLSAATFGLPPVELLRRYLYKNHLWRTGQYKVPKQALVDDHLGWSGGEAFAADGFRNAFPLTGAANVTEGAFLNPQRHLLAYGAGWGEYANATGIGSAADFATDSVRAVFTHLYGDYLGDWDFETNPLMPSLLASKGGVLAVSWAGRPHWMMHGLATGETIGYCLKETQNAQYNTAYGDSNGESGAHISLLGDPTLRATIVPPAANVNAVSNCDKVNLSWTAPDDPDVLGYVVYRAFSQDGPYVRVTPGYVFQTTWEDLSPVADTLWYSVRAVKLEITPGGGAFYNTSTGAPQSVIFVPGTGPTAIALGGVLNCNVSSLTLGTNFQPSNSTVEWFKPDGTPNNGFLATEGGVYTVIVTAPNGCTVAAYASVYMDTLLPAVNFPSFVLLNCATPGASFIVPEAPNGVHYYYNGAEVFPGNVLSINGDPVFVVSSAINGCSNSYQTNVQQDFASPGATITHNGLTLDCNHASVQLFGNTNTPNVTYSWTGPSGWTVTQQNPVVTSPGSYCLTVTGANGCTSTACVVVNAVGTVLSAQITLLGDPCAEGKRNLQAIAAMGVEPYQYQWSSGGTGSAETLPAGFSGLVTLTVTDAGACTAVAAYIVTQTVDLLAFTEKESAPGAADGSIDLLIISGEAPFTYQWSNGATTEDLSGLTSGNYTVTVTAANGCSKVLSIPLFNTVGANEPGEEGAVFVYPNPVKDWLTVEWKEKWQGQTSIRLTDATGRIVVQEKDVNTPYKLDLRALPDGIYLIWLENAGIRVVRKIVLQQ